MKYLKSFNENRVYLKPERYMSLKYDIEEIFADMTDDSFQIEISIGRYLSNIELKSDDIDWRDSRFFQTTLGKYSSSLHRFFDYVKDEGFHIDYIDLFFKTGKHHQTEVNLTGPNDDVLNKTLMENKDRILSKVEIMFYPIK